MVSVGYVSSCSSLNFFNLINLGSSMGIPNSASGRGESELRFCWPPSLVLARLGSGHWMPPFSHLRLYSAINRFSADPAI